MNNKKRAKGFLIYLIDDCLKDFKTLGKVNTELIKGMSLSSNADVNYLGILNRCVQGYFIIEVASLFDKSEKAISLYNILDQADVRHKNTINNLKKNDIVKKIIKTRHKFAAHHDFRYLLDDGKFGLNTHEIINSNLNKVLAKCKNLINAI